MRKHHITCIAFTASLLCLTSTLALATSVPDTIAQFASRHGVRVKQVTRKVGNRQVRRIFVPLVRGETAMNNDFVKTFLTEDRMLLFARSHFTTTYPYDYYVRAAFKTDHERKIAEVWGSAYDVGPKASIKNTKTALNPLEGSRTVVLNVGQSAVQNAKGFLRRFHKSQSYDRNIRVYKQTMEQEGKTPGDCAADCMWWLPNLNVKDPAAQGTQNLMQLLGTKRTRGPQEMPPLAIHAAKNQMVEVIGVGVSSKESFNAMSNDELMGPKPTQGNGASWVRE